MSCTAPRGAAGHQLTAPHLGVCYQPPREPALVCSVCLPWRPLPEPPLGLETLPTGNPSRAPYSETTPLPPSGVSEGVSFPLNGPHLRQRPTGRDKGFSGVSPRVPAPDSPGGVPSARFPGEPVPQAHGGRSGEDHEQNTGLSFPLQNGGDLPSAQADGAEEGTGSSQLLARCSLRLECCWTGGEHEDEEVLRVKCGLGGQTGESCGSS